MLRLLYTHAHTNKQTNTCTCTHTHIHTHTQTNKQTNTHTHKETIANTHIYMYMQVRYMYGVCWWERCIRGTLMTGFRKSLCYGCLPMVFDLLLDKEHKSVVVVIVSNNSLLPIMHNMTSTQHETALAQNLLLVCNPTIHSTICRRNMVGSTQLYC